MNEYHFDSKALGIIIIIYLIVLILQAPAMQLVGFGGQREFGEDNHMYGNALYQLLLLCCCCYWNWVTSHQCSGYWMPMHCGMLGRHLLHFFGIGKRSI